MISYRGLLILVIFIGIILITIEVTRTSAECPLQKTIYRYIPRTFEEEQRSEAYVTDIFKSMFEDPSPWILSVDNLDRKQMADVEKYFISQT
jgi:hypothetical protein